MTDPFLLMQVAIWRDYRDDLSRVTEHDILEYLEQEEYGETPGVSA